MKKFLLTIEALSFCAAGAFAETNAGSPSAETMVLVPGGTFEMGDTFGDRGGTRTRFRCIL
jgi:formylglycine-generating enzyme required for sulfatase activity